MDLAAFAEELKATSVSQAIQSHLWVVPTVQSIHILAIAVVFASALFLNLRILRLVGADEPILVFARRYVPWIWGGLLVLVLTGLTMVVGEPDRTRPLDRLRRMSSRATSRGGGGQPWL